MAVLFTNNAQAALSATITAAATSFSVAAGLGALFPSPGVGDHFFVTLADTAGNLEIVKVTARNTDTFTVVRGQDGTEARAFSSGDKVELRLTKAMLDQIKLDTQQNIAGNLSFTGTGNRITGDFSNATIANRVLVQSSTANGNTFLGVVPNGTAVNSQFQAYNSSDTANASIAALVASASQVRIVSGYIGTGTLNPITFIFSNTEAARFDPTTRNFLIGSSTDNGTDKLQVTGSANITGAIKQNGNQVLHAGNYTDYAAAAGHTHSYLPLSGGTVTGTVKVVSTGGFNGDTGDGSVNFLARLNSDSTFLGAINQYGYQAFAVNILGSQDSTSSRGYVSFYTKTDGTWKEALRLNDGAVNAVNTLTQGGNQVLHAGNYSSYSPSLTGSGASGTWGINVTGYSTQLNGYGQQTVYTILDGPANGPVIKVRYDGATANRWIDFGYKDGYGAYYEGLKIYNGDTLTMGGAVVLNASNYSSYSPSLTGSGASGTWSINVTGSATSVGGYSSDGWLRKVGDASQFQVYGNSRSIIFRTDGTTNEHGGGGYPYIWFYGGSQDTDRRMIMNTSGQLWLSNYGWLHDAFSSSSHNHGSLYLRALGGNDGMDFNTLAYNTMYYAYIANSANKPGSYSYPYGTVLTFDPGQGAGGRAQFYISHAGNDLIFRGGWNGNDSWQTWNKVLTDQNYSSYAAPASHSHSFDSLTSKTGGTGDYMTTGSFIAQGILRVQNGTADWDSLDLDANGATHIINARGAETGLSFQFDGTERMFLSNGGALTLNNGAIRQGNDLARPLARFDAAGSTTGMVIIKLPGDTNNYGMIHAVLDIYEYSGNSVSTVIIGGHNWGGSTWYNYGANVIGATDKQVRLGIKDGQYCIVIGTADSVWSYGQVLLRKIQNGTYYGNIMNLAGTYSVSQTATESFTWVSGDLRYLRTPGAFNAVGAITQNGNQVLHAANYTNYSPSYSGGVMGGQWQFTSNLGNYCGSLSGPGLQAYSTNNNSAFLSFHKSGHYAVNMGLDADNVLRIGGWSAAANRWQLDMSGNNTVAGSITSGGNGGFMNDVYYGGVRNPIWRFGNADSYGLSYFQGSAGIGGADTIGFHFGTATSAASQFAITSAAAYVNGNTVLHAGNHTNYTPVKVAGSSGYPHAGYGMFPFYNWGGANGGASAPSDGSYTIGISVGSHPSDQAYGFQIARNMWNTGLWTRGYDSGWGGWVRLLDSSNYTDYGDGRYVRKTGDTMTGTLTVGRDVIVNGQTGGNYGNRIVVGASDTSYTMQDTNLRPTIQANGQYPVLSLNHTITSNSNHGPTIQMTANGVGNQFVIGMTGNGSALDMGYSSATDWNPHNGIAGYNGTTFFRATSGGYIGIGAPGDWGPLGNGDPGYHLHFKGTSTYNQGYAAVFENLNNAANNGGGVLFQNNNSNHSWGTVAEIRTVAGAGGGDRPSLLFSTSHANTSWSVGFVTGSDDTFRISKNHGHRAFYNGWADNNSGWGTAYFYITSAGVASANGGTLLSSANYTNYTLPPWNIQNLSDQYSAAVNTAGWYTIASHSGARGYAEFFVYDNDSSRHNFVKLGVVFSFGSGGITVLASGRHGTSTIRHARLLYNTSDQTYGGAKLQIYCENPSWYIITRMGNDERFSGWDSWGIITPVLENTPSGWAEYTRVEAINDQGVIGGTRLRIGSTDALIGGYQALHAGNYSSYAVPQSDVSTSGGASKVLKTEANGYLYLNSWMQVNGGGLFSSTNSAHLLPNDANYGAWKILGTRNGWGGLEFPSNNGHICLMVSPNSNETGIYNPSYGWQIYWTGGTLYNYKNSYGGGTQAAVLDSANYAGYALPLSGGIITGNTSLQGASGISLDFYNTTTPSTTSVQNRWLGGSSFVGKNSSGTYHVLGNRFAREISYTNGATFGSVVDEAYVSNVLNIYTQLYQDSWGIYSSYATGSLARHFAVLGTSIGPGSSTYDNSMSAGTSTARYTIVYATTGTINTSDVREKEQIQDLDAAELRVATAIKGLIKRFKWKEAVAKKGEDARIHVGVIAQEVEQAFIAEGLNPAQYALFCQDVWWEKMVPNENYGRPECPNEPELVLETFQTEVEGALRKERKGIRYDQLLAFVIAAT